MINKLLTGLLLAVISLQAYTSFDCHHVKGCERKFCEIEKQISTAQEKNNRHKVSGLNRSLKNARANCTDQSLKDTLVKKITDARADIAEYEADIEEAEKAGKSRKVTQYQQKISEKEREVKSLEKELFELQ